MNGNNKQKKGRYGRFLYIGDEVILTLYSGKVTYFMEALEEILDKEVIGDTPYFITTEQWKDWQEVVYNKIKTDNFAMFGVPWSIIV